MNALTLADVATLAQVQRPVVTVWRGRPVADHPFPSPDAAGRYDAVEIADWLVSTGRGNNPQPHADVALLGLRGLADGERDVLAALLALRIAHGAPLATLELDDLLDVAEESDPDDTFCFREIESCPTPALPALLQRCDAIAAAAWDLAASYDAVAPTQHGELAAETGELVTALVRALHVDGSALLDVAASGTSVAVELAGAESAEVVVPAAATDRAARRRYLAHGLSPAWPDRDDDWGAEPGSVALVVRPDGDDCLEWAADIALNLPTGAHAVVVGPASLLTDVLPDALLPLRDDLIRSNQLRAVVRLPQGLTTDGARRHLALAVLSGREPADRVPWGADLSGATLDRATAQRLLDDLVAATTAPRGRSFAYLTPLRRTEILVGTGSVLAGAQPLAELPVSASDDASRLAELLDALTAEPAAPPHFQIAAIGTQTERTTTLGEAVESCRVRILPGLRASLPAGSTPVWTADALATGVRPGTDLLALTATCPDVRLTEPGDVVFTSHAKPTAVVDRHGGAVVAFPARALRLTGDALAPAALADAVNAVPAGNRKWHTWRIPLLGMPRPQADLLLQQLDDWSDQLVTRQTQLTELRRLVTRSVLSGAITLESLDPTQKGQ